MSLKSTAKSRENLINDISSIREEFYNSTRKKIFFTNSQKKECADYITSKISLPELIHGTVYIIRDSMIYIDYSLFKQYASPTNYDFILKHLFDCIYNVMQKHGQFELHVYLATFSISAAERYKDFIQAFYRIYFQSDIDYCDKMTGMYIYHVPSMMNTISTLLRSYMTDSLTRPAKLRDKIFMYTKEESVPKLSILFGRMINGERMEDDDYEDDTPR